MQLETNIRDYINKIFGDERLGIVDEMLRERVEKWHRDRENAERAIKTAMAYGEKSLRAKSIAEKEFYMTKAIETLTKEIENQPRQPMLTLLHMSRGDLLIAAKDYERARKDFEIIPLNEAYLLENFAKKGVDLVKKVHGGLLRVEYHLSNYEKAIEHFIKMRMGESVPKEVLKDAQLKHYAKGEMFFANKKYDEAIKEYEKVLKMDPEFENETLKRFGTQSKDMFFYKLALNEVARRNLESAKRYCERALEINPKNKKVKKALKKIEKASDRLRF